MALLSPGFCPALLYPNARAPSRIAPVTLASTVRQKCCRQFGMAMRQDFGRYVQLKGAESWALNQSMYS